MSGCAATDRLVQTLLVHTPGSNETIIKLELFNLMDDFFRRTNAWKSEVPFNLIQGQAEYAIPVPAGAIVVRMMSIMHNGVPVPPTSQAGVTQNSLGQLLPEQTFPDGDALYQPTLIDIDGSNIFSWAIYRPDYITVSGDITADMVQYPLNTVFSLSLDKGCLECDCGDWDVPDWMWDTYFRVWNDGVLASLYGMPAKPWSNAQLALVHGKRYRNRQGFHKQEAARGFAYNTPTWRFPRGW